MLLFSYLHLLFSILTITGMILILYLFFKWIKRRISRARFQQVEEETRQRRKDSDFRASIVICTFTCVFAILWYVSI